MAPRLPLPPRCAHTRKTTGTRDFVSTESPPAAASIRRLAFCALFPLCLSLLVNNTTFVCCPLGVGAACSPLPHGCVWPCWRVRGKTKQGRQGKPCPGESTKRVSP